MKKIDKSSGRAAEIASKVLRDSRSSKSSKSLAGSALSQSSNASVVYDVGLSAALRVLRMEGESKAERLASGRVLARKKK